MHIKVYMYSSLTGGGSGTQQLVAGVAGADRVGVEVCIADDGVVAAPRVGRVALHEWERTRGSGLSREGGRGAALRLGSDPHGARRALIAARSTGDVCPCARYMDAHIYM
jgi:hypothetical protein